MKTTKKLFSILLVVLMCMTSVLLSPVSAAETTCKHND